MLTRVRNGLCHAGNALWLVAFLLFDPIGGLMTAIVLAATLAILGR